MTKDVLLSVRISRRLNAKLDKLAKLSQRTKSWLVNAILLDRVDGEIEFAEAVEEGMRDLEHGRTIPHEDVVAEFKARAKARRKRAA